MRCQNKVMQAVPRGFDYKMVEMQCGSTGIHGNALWCDKCRDTQRVKNIEANSKADNEALRSAGWGEI